MGPRAAARDRDMSISIGPVTKALAGITLVAFLILLASGLTQDAAIIGGFIPARVEGLDLGPTGAPPWLPVWLTPLSATLVHAGWLHIGFNLLMLLFCSGQVEQVLGPRQLVVLYVVGAYAAAMAQWAIDPGSVVPMVGASGAISAVLATYALLFSQQSVRAVGPFSANIVRILWLGAAWVGLQLLIGLAGRAETGFGQIAVAAHVGGFIAGLILTRPLLRWRFRLRR